MINFTVKLTSHVLIADDNRFMRTVLRDILKEDGYEIVEACDGAETIRLFEQYQPDLVILDIIMPEINGCSVCKQLRSLESGKAIPILMLTAREDEETIKTTFAAGADDYITKDFNPLVLRHRIKRLLEAERDRKMVARLAWTERLNVIGEIAAGIGHEVRNPMTTVRGFLQFLSRKEELKNQLEYFDLMIKELDRANNIITEFLLLAKDKAMDFQRVPLNEIIHKLFPMLQADAFLNSCQIVLALEETPPILLDAYSIRQVILNMTRNAIEAMPEGGKIIIRTGAADQKVFLAIEDEGAGISPEILQKIGNPFVTTKEHGSGLGLAICYRIAQRHGAGISVSSTVGQGTVFTVTFNPAISPK
ncbi:response regulator [Acetonema longum]|uniref:histidine kinase n=1 Tax=Acetonema longum DSM 6540 TaxID=1009370 RepID=F7NF40_9FIRM|nr:response regulator [Acetonema longum]EGO65295.1 PAS/PAC sensor signal transduction histidine kinase [Acetonema longum DSM 6540]